MKDESKRVKEAIDKLLDKIEANRKEISLEETEKERLFKNILKWADEFSKTERFKRILKAVRSEEFLFFSSKWGNIKYEIPEKDKKISCMIITSKGKLIYKAFYKEDIIKMDFNKKNLDNFKLDYITKLNDHIENEDYLRLIEHFLNNSVYV